MLPAVFLWAACGGGEAGAPVDEGDTDSDVPISTPAIDGSIRYNPPLDTGDSWSPSGKWGADGNMGGGGGGYGALGWECLICDEPRPAQPADVIVELAMRLVEAEQGRADPRPLVEDAPEVLYVSADDSNSQSSAVVARQRILAGDVVDANLLRVWEFLNYYDFTYAEPIGGKAIRIEPQLRPYDAAEGIYALQLGLQGKHVDSVRRALNITFSVDTTGSMSGQSLSLAKESMRAMASHFRSGDRVSLVGWNTTQTVWLDSEVVSGPDDPDVLAAIEGLVASGSTNLHAGLVAAYTLANENFVANAMNRVVLLSDGGANVGVTDADLIALEAAGGEDEAIYLVGVGVGNAYTYNDELMDTVTDLGKGASVFVDSAAEAHRAFEDHFLANMEMVAHDVQIRLTLPPGFEMYEFLGEEYSEDPDEVEPQSLSPNDAMIVQQLIKADDPDAVGALDEIGVRVTWTDAFTGLADEAEGEWTLQELIDAEADELRKGDAIVVYVQTLGRIAEAMSSYPHDFDAVTVECAWGAGVLDDAIAVLDDPDLEDLAALLDYYCDGLLGG
jgi:Ca-activated chloride channel family protein